MGTNTTVETIEFSGFSFDAIGNSDLLNRSKTPYIASRKCPASEILEAHAQFKTWAAEPSMTIVSGFHSPLERECLRQLLNGVASIIFLPARSMGNMRIRKEWLPVLAEDRMLIISPFKNKQIDRAHALERNDLIRQVCRPNQ